MRVRVRVRLRVRVRVRVRVIRVGVRVRGKLRASCGNASHAAWNPKASSGATWLELG